MRINIPEKAIPEIITVLIKECKMMPHHEKFIKQYLSSELYDYEYRFMGALGFGGKLYIDNFSWRVGCYSEEENPERLVIIDKANIKLAELRNKYTRK